ncbi:MAG TPA: hypothetical protein VFM05_07845 [Candidatus Saccharimonadales bacterium]|nr:hypothetical protein [Candidatus Saccharimonadales bacterium]
MSDRSPYQEVTVHWRPHAGDGSLIPDISLPTLRGNLEPTPDSPLTLFLVGLGEGRASGEAAVNHWEQDLGLPAAAAWLSYGVLPVCEANLTRIAVEAPQVIAEHYAGTNPVHLVTNSLGCLGVNAAAEAPERFSHIASTAPYALANEYRGHIPRVGSPLLARAGALGLGLMVRTPLQLWGERGNPDLRDVAQTALREARSLGMALRVAADNALSVKIGRRTADSYARLAVGHPECIVTGSDDHLVNAGHVQTALGEAAAWQDIDVSIMNGVITEVPGPHAPWCISQGMRQLSAVGEWLVQSRQA